MLAQYLNRIGYMPEQVQDFYPTPGTLSTAMYYTGIDPRTMKPVYVAKTPEEKAMQRALLQWRRPDKRPIILAALKKAGREDLIGYGKECLIRPNRSGEQNVAPRSSKPAHRHGVRLPMFQQTAEVSRSPVYPLPMHRLLPALQPSANPLRQSHGPNQ